ncbi:MAG: response regulator transcription factor [Dysgonomonas sp.]|nr:response regulator transcription factor [Dysgonomonas sp.]
MREIIIFDKQDITRIGIERFSEKELKNATPIIVNNKTELIKNLISTPYPIIILDYSLSDFASIDELLNTSYRFPLANWLLFSDELSYDFLRQLVISSKSFSIVLKMCNVDEIRMGLIHALKGERFLCSEVTNLLLQAPQKTDNTLNDILTPTEKEVLKEIALGRTTKEIASKRNLSIHTIISHRKNIFRKLEVNNVHEATKYAMRAGIVDLAEYYI